MTDLGELDTTVRVQAIVTEHDGSTRFADESVPLNRGSGPLWLSAPVEAVGMGFNRAAEGFERARGPSPCRQELLVTEGELEVTTSDGEARLFRPGDVLSLRDTWGEGHRRRVPGGRAFRSAIIALDGIDTGAETPPLTWTDRDGIDYLHNQEDAQGRSYFERKRLAYLRGSADGMETAWFPLKAFQYVLAPGDLDFSWHPAPQRQIVLVLTGGLSMVYGDGSEATVMPGGFLVGEDTSGRGHVTRALDGAVRLSVFAHLR